MSMDKVIERLKRAQSELDSADVSSLESCVDDATRAVNDALQMLEGGTGDVPEFSYVQMNFLVRVDDLAEALYNGTIPSRSVNGSGSRSDARLQAEVMLTACGFNPKFL